MEVLNKGHNSRTSADISKETQDLKIVSSHGNSPSKRERVSAAVPKKDPIKDQTVKSLKRRTGFQKRSQSDMSTELGSLKRKTLDSGAPPPRPRESVAGSMLGAPAAAMDKKMSILKMKTQSKDKRKLTDLESQFAQFDHAQEQQKKKQIEAEVETIKEKIRMTDAKLTAS